MPPESLLRIDVWSDYICPFCYLEIPVLDRLQSTFGPALEVRWHAFELRPEPVPTLDPAGDYLRTTWARAVYPLAAERGMKLRLPPVQPRSRLAFEAAEHARAEGRFDAVHRGIFRAFFEDGRDIGETAVLLEVGAAAGIEVGPLGEALQEGRHAEVVRRDQRLADELGISAVPALLLRRADTPLQQGTALSGAQSFDRLHAIIEKMATGQAPSRPTF